jgi:hypothetical protein
MAGRGAEINRSPWLNPLVIGYSWSLVIDAIKTDRQKACNNLLFLANAKLLYDTDSAIKQVSQNQPQQAPALGLSNSVIGRFFRSLKEGLPLVRIISIGTRKENFRVHQRNGQNFRSRMGVAHLPHRIVRQAARLMLSFSRIQSGSRTTLNIFCSIYNPDFQRIEEITL